MHHDLHGNLTEVTDEQGELVGRARYNALGQTLYSTIPPTITGRLPGGAQLDADAGLVHNGAGRFYALPFSAKALFNPAKAASSKSIRSWMMLQSQSSTLVFLCNCVLGNDTLNINNRSRNRNTFGKLIR